MGTGPAHRQPYGPGGHVPRRHRILQQEVRWRPPKWDSRVPATLVPDGAAPRTQESHPSTLGGLGAHIERFDSRVPLDATPPGWPPPYDRTSGPCTATTCAPSVLGVSGWVSASRRASRSAGACTCSICVRVALRRVVPCAAPEALGGPGAPARAHCARRAGAGRARGARLLPAHATDPARRTGRTREGVTAPLRAPHGAPGVTARKPNPPMPACERDAHAGWVLGSRTACGYRPRP